MLGVMRSQLRDLRWYTAARLGNLRLRSQLAWSEVWVGARMETRAGRVHCWWGVPFLHILATWDSVSEPEPEIVHVYNQHGEPLTKLRMSQTLYNGLMRGSLVLPDGEADYVVQHHTYLSPAEGWYVRVFDRRADPPGTNTAGWTSWEQFYEQFHQ